jgi:hypothetical protein
MKLNSKVLLPGWTFKVDEFSPGAYRVTLTDGDGRKAEIVDDYNDATLDKCIGYAFDIERQVTKNWNKFLFDFSNLRLTNLEIHEREYNDQAFGSWTIQAKDKRLLLDGKDGWLIYEEKQNGSWVDKDTIKDFKRVTFDQFKRFIRRIE